MQEKPLIDYPEGMAPGRKAADQTITVLSTGAMLYFLAAITLGIWYFAGFYFVDSVFSWRQFEATTALLLQLLLVALVSLLLFLSWAEYNFRMYAHRNRRRAAPAVRAAEVAAFFGVATADVMLAQQAKSMVFQSTEGMYSICELGGHCVKLRRVETDTEDEK